MFPDYLCVSYDYDERYKERVKDLDDSFFCMLSSKISANELKTKKIFLLSNFVWSVQENKFGKKEFKPKLVYLLLLIRTRSKMYIFEIVTYRHTFSMYIGTDYSFIK